MTFYDHQLSPSWNDFFLVTEHGPKYEKPGVGEENRTNECVVLCMAVRKGLIRIARLRRWKGFMMGRSVYSGVELVGWSYDLEPKNEVMDFVPVGGVAGFLAFPAAGATPAVVAFLAAGTLSLRAANGTTVLSSDITEMARVSAGAAVAAAVAWAIN